VDTQFDKGGDGKSKKGSLKGKKVKKRVKLEDLLSQQDKDDKARDVLRMMEVAAEKDVAAMKEQKPAIYKLKILKKVMAELNKQAYQEEYLNWNLCELISKWLAPLPGGELCNKNIREQFYDFLAILPVEEKHLTSCQIGKLLIQLANHPDESMENKIKIKKIVEKWMRPIFNKSQEYAKRMEQEYAHRTVDKNADDNDEYDDVQSKRRRKKKKKKKQSRDAIQSRLANQKREPQPGEPGFTWYAKIPKKMNLSGLKRIRKGKLAAKKTGKSKRQHDISRKLVKLQQKSNSKSADLRPVKVSVQGRGL